MAKSKQSDTALIIRFFAFGFFFFFFLERSLRLLAATTSQHNSNINKYTSHVVVLGSWSWQNSTFLCQPSRSLCPQEADTPDSDRAAHARFGPSTSTPVEPKAAPATKNYVGVLSSALSSAIRPRSARPRPRSPWTRAQRSMSSTSMVTYSRRLANMSRAARLERRARRRDARRLLRRHSSALVRRSALALGGDVLGAPQ